MDTENLDPRVLLAKMDQELQDAKVKAEKLAKEHEVKRKELLLQLREEDLADVREKCVLHGFTATDLKGAIRIQGRGRPPAATKPKRDPNAPKRKYTRRAKTST